MSNWWLAGLGIWGFGAVACSAGPTMDAAGSTGAGGSDGTAAEAVCRELVAQVARDTQTTGNCTVAVRVDYTSLKIMGHAYYCGETRP